MNEMKEVNWFLEVSWNGRVYAYRPLYIIARSSYFQIAEKKTKTLNGRQSLTEMFSLFLLFSTRWILFSKENQPFKKNQWKSLYVFREAECAWEWVCVIQLLFQCIVIVRVGIECVNCSFSIQFNQIRIWFSSFFREFQLKYIWSIKLNGLCQQLISFYAIPFHLIWFHWIAHDWMTWFHFALSRFACCLSKKRNKKTYNID